MGGYGAFGDNPPLGRLMSSPVLAVYQTVLKRRRRPVVALAASAAAITCLSESPATALVAATSHNQPQSPLAKL